ncbi:MAG: RuBisCO large subunit C-terminal-like domain-containing protein [Methanothrix sp.]|jgi:ribulose-bisphosphate carboxylase large chain|uniref:Ribulose-1,5-bisphosphate carboxylase/oxygenase large subunit n=1 Tax=Methanothrix harundinacea TaxID=301375 RepID=A0A101FVE4_9EURY|nr:MAG: ribulose 1,5-bisphosphate carboxylase [Methanosaeta sp. SDB]KUK45129.1 MAG: Ribulose-1,5-bisphosphate carboxylase/oxygenase large subunit [Methanothrix harundinacea]MDD2637966.1 RuBisCO large subunit C-terminal-like domain-containing protein [Methanothrix sp.]MDI9398557.1 RuBisCO large subunit C-terminal-like domain-containing protein [Euryarchaeota archaeon]KUK97394.1 MAG: Ribulose-1,5-bisphosphate carboxylase/oxygenase large subunit [Methanothrix harundinacea]
MEVIAKYRVETDLPIDKAAEAIAAEQSTGTWTEVEREKLAGDLAARVIQAEGNFAYVAFPEELFEPGNIPQYLSVVAGNLFGLGDLNKVRLLDVVFPKSLVKAHKGPRFGIDEARKILGIFDRPLVGTIIKPKVGLSPKETAEVAGQAARGGLDLIKDDETLTDQAFCPIDERVEAVMAELSKVEDETGKNAFYAVNVTCGADEILDRAEDVIGRGANMVMVDVLTAGFSALEVLSRGVKVPVHVHRTMHGAFSRDRRHGISMVPISRLVRMAGGTNLHTGSYLGKMAGDREENDQCRDALRDDWYGLRPVFPVASGGVHPGNVRPNLEGYGIDCIVQAGGGVHGHPWGTSGGAKAMVQAVEAWKAGVSAEEYAKSHKELEAALKFWSR